MTDLHTSKLQSYTYENPSKDNTMYVYIQFELRKKRTFYATIKDSESYTQTLSNFTYIYKSKTAQMEVPNVGTRGSI